MVQLVDNFVQRSWRAIRAFGFRVQGSQVSGSRDADLGLFR